MTTLQRAESDVNTYLIEELAQWFEQEAQNYNYGEIKFKKEFIRIDKEGQAYAKFQDEDGMSFREYVPESLNEIAVTIAK